MKKRPLLNSRLYLTCCLATLAVTALVSLFAGPAVAAITQQAWLKDSDPGQYDHFGWSTAIEGDTLVVGAPFDFGDGHGPVRAGTAFVYVRHGATWNLQASLKASNTASNDSFGYSVAISGDTIVVGAISESSSATGVNGDQSDNSVRNAGAAYVFVRDGTNWTQQAYLKASDTGRAFPSAFDVGDLFGYSVGIWGDTVVVAAPYEESNATGINGSANDNSARASGAAYVFVRSGTNWSQQAYLKSSNSQQGDQFGHSVAVSADTVVVGARWEDSNATGVNGDQSDNSAQNSGAAYVFVRDGTNWTQQAYLKSPSNTAAPPPPPPGGPYDSGDSFGWAVAVSGDTVVVGAFQEDSSATGVDGDPSDNSAPESGAAYVFARSGTNWTQQAYLKASNTAADDRFGVSVAVAGDTVVVGAHWEDSSASGVNGRPMDNSIRYASGAAYVFARSGTNWTQQAYLKASPSSLYSLFGWAVAVSGDTAVVGALGENSNTNGIIDETVTFITQFRESGAAYVFAGLGPPPDSDGDGVSDDLDQCPNTAGGAAVDSRGCSAEQRDSDHDGVPDSHDECPNTPAGMVVNAQGCGLPQLCACEGEWLNHGEYVTCVVRHAWEFYRAGLIAADQRREYIRAATVSNCGR